MEPKDKYLVCARCFTFNHAKYIEDAMNGFTMQQTDFPFVCVIVDDASTDGEPEVIKKYLAEHFEKPYREEGTDYANIICAHHKTNINCDFAVLLLKYNHYSIKKSKMGYISEWLNQVKYQALCEGDDYWIHPQKLQKQVDVLEKNDEVNMCAHASLRTRNGKKRPVLSPRNEDCIIPFEDVLIGGGGFVATCSLMFRHRIFQPSRYVAYYGIDYAQQIQGSLNGLLYLAEPLSVYRLSTENSWTVKMTKNPELYKIANEKIKRMLDIFDEDTDYKYTEIVKKRKHIIDFTILCSLGDIKGMKKKEYKDLYTKLPVKQKVKIYIKKYFSFVSII